VQGELKHLMRFHQDNEKSDIFLAGDYMIYPTCESAAQSGWSAAKKL
jgi:hypothetical protein